MKTQRYYALDVFRGATVALMILVNNPGTWSHMFSPLQHAPWHGLTPTDLVFPFFLFAVGNAMAFVMPKLQAAGDAIFWSKVIKRTLIIFLIGLFLNWWPFMQWKGDGLVFRAWVDPDDPHRGVRILGVLQRIAIAYFFASILVYYLRWKTLLYTSAGLLLAYWLMCLSFGGADPYSLNGWFGTRWDVSLLGIAHIYKGEGIPFDPEGLISTLPAIVQVIGGYFTGLLIVRKGQIDTPFTSHVSASSVEVSPTANRKHEIYYILSKLMVFAVLVALAGLIWSLDFPINKKIWTSSYVLVTTGLAMLCIGVMIWYLEIKEIRAFWTRFFDVFGKNPLFIFVLSGLLPRLLSLFRWQIGTNDAGVVQYTSPLPWFYQQVCKPLPGSPEVGSFVYSLLFLVFFWFIAYCMDKRKIYIKV